MRIPRALVATVVAGLVATSCAYAGSSPNLPRPVGPAVATVTASTLPPTTSAATTAHPDCPAVHCMTFQLVDDAVWSDGRPVTAADFAATIRHVDEPVYDQIRSVEVLDRHRLRVMLNAPVGPWESMFLRVLPEDYEPGADMTTTRSNGAFHLTEWVPGDRIVVTRDPAPWPASVPIAGQQWGDVSEIRFVFYPDSGDLVDALADGQVDVVVSRSPDVIRGVSDITSANHVVSPGPLWEHLDFHHDDPLLGQLWVREVVALAVDREKILDRTVRVLNPAASALNSTQWLSNDARYADSYSHAHDPERAIEILEDHFCTVGTDGIYECQGRRMSFLLAATNDDPDRIATFESISEDLDAVGIEVDPLFRSRSDFLSPGFLFAPSDVWQLIAFSWRARSDPQLPRGTVECGGALNVNRYCNPDVDELLDAAARNTVPAERMELISQADREYLDDLALIPLYQKPVLLSWSRTLFGPTPNVSPSTDLWSVGAWSGKQSITVALDAEPTHLDPTRTDDDNANVVLSTLLYGAFGMTPDFEFVPVLIDHVELIEGSPR